MPRFAFSSANGGLAWRERGLDTHRITICRCTLVGAFACSANHADADRNGYRAAVSYWAMQHTFLDRDKPVYREDSPVITVELFRPKKDHDRPRGAVAEIFHSGGRI